MCNDKNAEKEALNLSEKLSAQSWTTWMPTVNSTHAQLQQSCEHAALKTAAEALMGPKFVARRSELILKSKHWCKYNDLSIKYESTEGAYKHPYWSDWFGSSCWSSTR